MSPFVTTPTLSSSPKDNNISVSIFLFLSFCALSTFCSIIFAVNFTGWFVVTVIGGAITKCRQELIKSFGGKKTEFGSMLDHRLNPHLNHFEDFRLSSKDNSLPLIPSFRPSNAKTKSSGKLDSILSLDFSFTGSTGDDKPSKNKKKKDIPVLAPSEYSQKRNEKRTKNIKIRHVPDIPSQLGPNRQKSTVDYYPSQRHSHQPKSKLSDTEKMIERTAAYRVGKKFSGWINGDPEEYAIKSEPKDSTTDYTNDDDPFYSHEPIKDLNVRLDEERPKITRQDRTTYNKSPAISLKYARQYLTILLTVKKEMNL